MLKLKHVAAAHVSANAVARVDFSEIDGCPWLEILPAGESNRAYLNAAMRQVDRNAVLRGRMSVEEISRERQQAIPLYAEHILTGNGGGWVSEEGAEVAMPLSVEDRLALLRQLPSDLFDRVRIRANDLQNFRS